MAKIGQLSKGKNNPLASQIDQLTIKNAIIVDGRIQKGHHRSVVSQIFINAYIMRFFAVYIYYLKYLLSIPSKALPCLASTRIIKHYKLAIHILYHIICYFVNLKSTRNPRMANQNGQFSHPNKLSFQPKNTLRIA